MRTLTFTDTHIHTNTYRVAKSELQKKLAEKD